MSLTNTMAVALSGLSTNQSALRVTSENVANVNTPDYVRKQVNLQSRVTGTEGTGVEIASISRAVDEFLRSELISAEGAAGFYDVQRDIHSKLQALLGQPDSELSINGHISTFFSRVSTLALDPSSSTRRIAVVQDLKSALEEINRISDEIQELRADADLRIANDIETVNSALRTVYELNPIIIAATIRGEEVAAIEEERDRAIDKIAQIIDIRTITADNGATEIVTESGVTLLATKLRRLSYDRSGTVETSTNFSQITIEQEIVGGGGFTDTGQILDTGLRSGRIWGLMQMRDRELPEIAMALGELAGKFMDQINSVQNAGSPVPPPNSLVGRNVGALATDPQGFTGTATFAVLDANNEISASVAIDFTGGGFTTIADVITAVNAGLGGAGTLSLTGGALTFAAAGGTDGVAILQDPTTPSDRGGRGFAHFFGLNDLVVARAPGHFDTGLTGTDAHGFGATGTVALELATVGGRTAATTTLDFSTLGGTVNDIVTALNTAFTGFGTFTLDGNGAIAMAPASGYESYTLSVSNDTTDRGGTGVNFNDFFGITHAKQMDAARELQVRSAVLDNDRLLSTATLNLTPPAGQPSLNVGDNTNVTSMQALQDASVGFRAAGELSAVNDNIDTYAGNILSTVALEASRTTSLADDREAIRNEVKRKVGEVSGVNLDEELANMILYQNSYNAAARMIGVANEMFEVLVNIG